MTISRSDIGPIIERPKAACAGQISGPAARCRARPKSLEKRREKPLPQGAFGVVLAPSTRYMILTQELTGFPFV
jgi:hypothetical protein